MRQEIFLFSFGDQAQSSLRRCFEFINGGQSGCRAARARGGQEWFTIDKPTARVTVPIPVLDRLPSRATLANSLVTDADLQG